jgi:hypothetical protein
MQKATIRLACMACDRSDFDGITPQQLRAAIKSGWKAVQRVQTHRQACKTYDDQERPSGYSAFEWWTHLGWCPDCANQAEAE